MTPNCTTEKSALRKQAHYKRHQEHKEEPILKIIKQPATEPVSQDQLIAEVKGIYSGLVMVESKCIEVTSSQNAQHHSKNNPLNNGQWEALIALHRALLHEHHDFFLATQHPSASPPVRSLPVDYKMVARMWRHGVHSFLELLRHRLPASLEHMLTFIYLAYRIIALLNETVPEFKNGWAECLGDLGRFRMAIEYENSKDREIWRLVSRGWYSKVSDNLPTTGRLYHHLAVLARPNALQQLYYYTKSLCVVDPFKETRDAIKQLFDPIMDRATSHQSRLPPTELAFVRCHGIMFSEAMFSGRYEQELEVSTHDFIEGLDGHISRSGLRFLESGRHMAIAICNAVIGYGNDDNAIYRDIRHLDQPDHAIKSSEITINAVKLANQTHSIVFRRFDTNTLPYVHVTLAFVYHMAFHSTSLSRDLAPDFPWKLCATYLNTIFQNLTGNDITLHKIEGDAFPEVIGNRPLPEDFAMRGLLWTEKYLPVEYFFEGIDDEDKQFEFSSMAKQRYVRVLYLGCRIAELGGGRYLRYHDRMFTVGPEYDIGAEGSSEAMIKSDDLVNILMSISSGD